MEIIKILADIIKQEMQLDNERVLIYNQKWNLPNTDDIFVYLAYLNETIFGNNRYYEDREDGYYEVQVLEKITSISINIFSKNSTARERKEEIVFAINSTYSQQQQEKYSFKVHRIPSNFNDISELEASSMLNRFNITIDVINKVEKEKIVEYYDKYEITTKNNL